MYLYMFSLSCSQKRQDNFVLSELRYRVNEKLEPSVRKQKIAGNPNTIAVIKINVLLFTCVPVSFESFRRDFNEAKAV